jgi:hypothetical protein
MSWDQHILLVIGLALIAGCAGHEALIWRTPRPYVESCGIRICEPSGVSGRIDPEKDCRCSGKNSIEDIFR